MRPLAARGQLSEASSGSPALNDTPADGPMAMLSPVRGLLPSRAGRSFLENLPKPAAPTSINTKFRRQQQHMHRPE